MKLKTLKLENFRSYKDETVINFNDLTTLIGKNDIGKSTILEALEIFFNNGIVKIDSTDACVYSESQEVKFTCVFTDLPDQMILDASAETTLRDEYLLNENGELEICKIFDCSKAKPTSKVYAIANHPTVSPAENLLEKKSADLKKIIADLEVSSEEIDLRSNVSMRAAIWSSFPDLELEESLIDLSKSDAKSVWEQIEKHLPIYALFQSDRSSSDSDNEVQDPMKVAVKLAIETVERDLEEIKSRVEAEVLEVALRTLEKLREMDPGLASELTPKFKEEPKWSSLFKLSLDGDDNIPMNKRGSGVRRLILLNFFRAEAERRRHESFAKDVIYAIEEPETAQHPNNQIMLAEALKEIAKNEGAQVILTTHVPGLAELIPEESLRFIDSFDGIKMVHEADEQTMERIAEALGVYPNPIDQQEKKVIVCVEGVHDVVALSDFSEIVSTARPELVNLKTNDNVIVMPLGGSTLKDWVQHRYLKNLGFPEVHIYDRDDEENPKYQQQCDDVNARGDGSCGYLTINREMENYIHMDAIEAAIGVRIDVEWFANVPELLAKAVHEQAEVSKPWDEVEEKKRKSKESRIKKRLNNEVIKLMTYEQLCEVDTNREIESWLAAITKLCNREEVIV